MHGSVFYFQRLEGADRRALGRHARSRSSIASSSAARSAGRSRATRRSSSARSKASPATSSGRISGSRSARRARSPRRRSRRTRRSSTPSPDCQRVALLNFFQTRLQQDESLPIDASDQDGGAAAQGGRQSSTTPIGSTMSYNFNHSRKENETFDVATYGTSANGIEGDPARIHVVNANCFTTLADQQAERAARHVLARDASAHRGAVEPRRRHRHGLRAHVPVRQPVLPAAGRRRADLAHPGQGQLLAGCAAATRSRPAASGCTR